MAFLNQYLPIYETPPFLQSTHLRKFGISLIGLHYCMQIIIMYFFIFIKAIWHAILDTNFRE